jgi:KDO2-lipid IV(A) lauroyltransferase
VKFRLEELLVRGIAAVVGLMPMRMVRSTGHAIGWMAYHLDRFHRRIALENLAHAFPSRTTKELDVIARAMFAHFGAVLLELLKFGTLSEAEMERLVDIEGGERVTQAYQQGRGVLLFTGHFGYWEVQGLMNPLHARPISVLARPLDNPHLHDRLERIRRRTGNSVIYRQGAIRKVLRELAATHGVAMLIDQHLHTPDAVYVDFFRRPAATTNALAALAVRTGAPVIPAFAMPIHGGRYRLVYEHPVEPPLEDTPEAIRDFTQRCTDVLEMYVRRHPELWLWMHRRWRQRPQPSAEASTAREAGVDL